MNTRFVVLPARPEMPPPTLVLEWFDKALGKKDQRPSLAVCDRLALAFQNIAIQANNRVIENAANKDGKPFEPVKSQMANVDLGTWERIRLRGFTDAVHQLLNAAAEIERDFEGHAWPCPARGEDGMITLDEIKDFLRYIAAVSPPPYKAPISAPVQPWHEVGRSMSRLVDLTLRELECTRVLAITNPDSATTIIAAQAVSWAFGQKIKPSTFAFAMKPRTRAKASKSKPLCFEERYPQAARIISLD